jgi:hypothetical protein
MSASTTPSDTGTAQSVFGQVAALSRDQKEHLLALLQEDLDGGPFVGTPPDLPPDDPAVVRDAWRTEIARRLDDLVTGRVQGIDAQGSAARLVQRLERKKAQ